MFLTFINSPPNSVSGNRWPRGTFNRHPAPHPKPIIAERTTIGSRWDSLGGFLLQPALLQRKGTKFTVFNTPVSRRAALAVIDVDRATFLLAWRRLPGTAPRPSMPIKAEPRTQIISGLFGPSFLRFFERDVDAQAENKQQH